MAIIGLSIVVASVWYTNQLAGKLSQTEENYVRLFEQAMEDISNVATEEDLQKSMTIQLEILERMETVPRILTTLQGEYVDAINFGGRDRDTAYIMGQLQKMIASGRPPVVLGSQLMYFGQSQLLTQLQFFPLIQLLLIGTFIFLGYLGINQARKAEQNRVWVGMAKETAHQLGTPISAIMGWLEHIKLMYEDQPDILEVSDEMGKDVERLSMVANRFSKIGAAPELEPVNVFAELDKCREYMEKRAPRKVSFDFPGPTDGDIRAAINPLLFDWVIENLLRNALDAMDGKGTISGSVRELEDKVYIDISDTGKGIAAKNVRKVFNPGFTTKKRGWGLGLSLVKRIVEQYHRGKIAVTASEVGKGTTFTITLPRA
ncbi:HAMP domain-containing sensor histidine kinase [Lewinella sp. W8]|uniref:sensor histidine kinase n=1 Tax=Lewinella sp. W8 TaxID=2528208 RepID=UPI0020A6A8DE|nr:HAMP domain-containing sensor histidine kinase [Lewinella sp. W8]